MYESIKNVKITIKQTSSQIFERKKDRKGERKEKRKKRSKERKKIRKKERASDMADSYVIKQVHIMKFKRPEILKKIHKLQGTFDHRKVRDVLKSGFSEMTKGN